MKPSTFTCNEVTFWANLSIFTSLLSLAVDVFWDSVYVRFRNTSGLLLTSVFQYFYFLLKKYWENSDTFYFYLSSFFSKYFYFYLSKKSPVTCTST